MIWLWILSGVVISLAWLIKIGIEEIRWKQSNNMMYQVNEQLSKISNSFELMLEHDNEVLKNLGQNQVEQHIQDLFDILYLYIKDKDSDEIDELTEEIITRLNDEEGRYE